MSLAGGVPTDGKNTNRNNLERMPINFKAVCLFCSMESYTKAATVHEIKQQLQQEAPAKIVEICLRLAKFKKENKELLTYLLFEADDVPTYIGNVKKEITTLFTEVNSSNLYFAKKTIRKILRITNKHIRYIGTNQAETELLLFFCTTLHESRLPIEKNVALKNLYANQLKKVKQAISKLHEDLQYDYSRELEKLG